MRDTSEYNSSPFQAKSDWNLQYTGVYQSRLKQLKPLISPPTTWSKEAREVKRVLDLKPAEPSWVIGVIVRQCKSKPNIIEDVTRINHGEIPLRSAKYCTLEDNVFLEDEHGRMQLAGSMLEEINFVTGLVVAVLGGQDTLGNFELLGVCYPTPLPPPSSLPERKSAKIALISGLQLSDSQHSPGIGLISDFLSENLDISRLVVAGNTLTPPQSHLVGRRYMRETQSVESLAVLDRFLATLGTIIPVSVMPGYTDPVSIAFPQVPMHPALFKNTKALVANGSVVFETNPCRLEIDGVEIIGTSGQNVIDISRYYRDEPSSDLELDILKSILKWNHLAPTAPDTLWSPPVSGPDPLVLTSQPNVLFAGNCMEFTTSIENGVRLICVPEFSKTGEIVLLDLNTLETEVVEIDINN